MWKSWRGTVAVEVREVQKPAMYQCSPISGEIVFFF